MYNGIKGVRKMNFSKLEVIISKDIAGKLRDGMHFCAAKSKALHRSQCSMEQFQALNRSQKLHILAKKFLNKYGTEYDRALNEVHLNEFKREYPSFEPPRFAY